MSRAGNDDEVPFRAIQVIDAGSKTVENTGEMRVAMPHGDGATQDTDLATSPLAVLAVEEVAHRLTPGLVRFLCGLAFVGRHAEFCFVVS